MGDAQSIPFIGEVATVIESGAKFVAAGGTVLVGAVAIPFIGNNNPILEAAGKLAEGAGNSLVEYSEKNAIVGLINAEIRERRGDEKGCKRIRGKVRKSVEGFVDSAPVLGHIKGIVHYAMGDIEHGNQCMLGATRGAAVTAVGALTGGLGAGVSVAGSAAVYIGVAYDVAASAIDLGVHEEGKGNVHGIVANFKEFAETKDPNVLVNICLTAAGDYSAGASGAKMAKEAVKIQTQKNALKNAYKKAQHDLPEQHAARFDPETATNDTIKAARNLEKIVKRKHVKGDGHVITRVVDDTNNQVSEGYSQRLRSDMNVHEFETKGQSSGFKSKTNAKKTAGRGPSVLQKQHPEVKPVLKRAQNTCAEHDAFNKLSRFGEGVAARVRVASVQFIDARTFYDNGMSPGKALNSHDSAYISYNGKEVPISSFEVLMAENPQHQPRWQPAYGGNVPEKSVLGGYSNDNEPLYIARAKAPDGGWCPGKLHPSHRVCYIPWGGKEHGIPNYEVLVLQ